MIRTRSEGGGFFFCFGGLLFWIGVLFLTTSILNTQVTDHNELVQKWAITSVFSSLFIYLGLAFLLKAGLGAFWNEMLDKAEQEKSRSAPGSIPGSTTGPDND